MDIFKFSYKENIIFEDNSKKLKGLFRTVNNYLDKEVTDSRERFYLYIYERFMSSLLLGCDYYSTSQFINEWEINDFGQITDINKFYDGLKKTEIYKEIRNYEKESYLKHNNFNDVKYINILRNEMFLDAEKS